MYSHLMDKEVLCILDTRQIQRFMFRANSYVDTCGGSDLILHILGDAIRFALHHIDTPLREGEYDLGNEADAPLPYFEDTNVRFQQIINTSGNAIFLARTGALAQKIIRKISRYYLDHGYSLNVAAAAVEKTGHMGHDISRLYRKLNAVKASSYISDPLEALPMVMRERRTGEPVVAFDEERGDYVSRASQIRRKESARRNVTVTPEDIPVTRAYDQREYWATIHADGNNLGNIIGRIMQANESYLQGTRVRRHINQNIVSHYNRILGRALADLEAFFCALGGNPDDFGREFVVVHQGGDDVNCICNGRLAIPFLHFFYRSLGGVCLWDSPELRLPLYICAGVAFVTRGTGFHAAFHLAEECCKSAKVAAKKEYNLRDGFAGNWLDFQICDNPSLQRLDILRKRSYVTREGVDLMLRPYCLDPEAAGESISYGRMLQRVRGIQSLQMDALQQRMMRESFAMGKREFYTWVNKQKQRGMDLEARLGPPLCRGHEGEKHAAWFDAVELLDFIPPGLEEVG